MRIEARLTQRDLAKLMRTSQCVIARLETGKGYLNLTTLEKLAEMTGGRLEVHFV